MPNMDGTGPRFGGQRPRAFRGQRGGMGQNFAGCRYGMFMGRGMGRGMGYCFTADTDEKEILAAQKAALQRNLDIVEKRLESL